MGTWTVVMLRSLTMSVSVLQTSVFHVSWGPVYIWNVFIFITPLCTTLGRHCGSSLLFFIFQLFPNKVLNLASNWILPIKSLSTSTFSSWLTFTYNVHHLNKFLIISLCSILWGRYVTAHLLWKIWIRNQPIDLFFRRFICDHILLHDISFRWNFRKARWSILASHIHVVSIAIRWITTVVSSWLLLLHSQLYFLLQVVICSKLWTFNFSSGGT